MTGGEGKKDGRTDAEYLRDLRRTESIFERMTRPRKRETPPPVVEIEPQQSTRRVQLRVPEGLPVEYTTIRKASDAVLIAAAGMRLDGTQLRLLRQLCGSWSIERISEALSGLNGPS